MMKKTLLIAVAAIALIGCSSGGDSNVATPPPAATTPPPPPPPPPPPANSAPVFTSPAAISVAENTTGVFYTATATDANNDTITFGISGGADAAAFSILPTGGLSFVSAPDFETPADADRDNVYNVTLSASDGQATATLALVVTVTDVVDAFKVSQVAVGLSQPNGVYGRGDGTNRVLITEKTGQIEVLDLDTGLLNPTPFLDISSSISTSGEGGLIGLALAPDFATSGLLYVHATNLAGENEIRQYRVSSTNPDEVDPSSLNVILNVPHPSNVNRGGWIGFGPDGFLWITFGDGCSVCGSNDEFGNAQNADTLLGAILRIDPSSDDFPMDDLRDYAIPADNPLVNGGGRPEIVAIGVRNPRRGGFDRVTGNFYFGDNGQSFFEEVNLIPVGAGLLNFGWPTMEGTAMNVAGPTDGLTPPVAQYQRGTGALKGFRIIGGPVYRGPVEALQAEYVFADFFGNHIWSIPANTLVLGSTVPSTDFIVRTQQFTPDSGVLESITAFGEDDAGNLYVVTQSGGIYLFERA